jgi:hypothetical protein
MRLLAQLCLSLRLPAHEATRDPPDRLFLWHLILGNFTKIC